MLAVYDNIIRHYLDRILQLYLAETDEEKEIAEEVGEEEESKLRNDDLD